MVVVVSKERKVVDIEDNGMHTNTGSHANGAITGDAGKFSVTFTPHIRTSPINRTCNISNIM